MRSNQTTLWWGLSVAGALTLGGSGSGCVGWKAVESADGSSRLRRSSRAPRSGRPRRSWRASRLEGPSHRAWVRGLEGTTSGFDGLPPAAQPPHYVVLSGPPELALGPVRGPVSVSGAPGVSDTSGVGPEPAARRPPEWPPSRGVEPPDLEPPPSEPSASEPTASEPPASEPTASEPTASEPTASEPTASEPPGAEPPTPAPELPIEPRTTGTQLAQNSADEEVAPPPPGGPLASVAEGQESAPVHEEEPPKPEEDAEDPPLSIAGRWDLEMAILPAVATSTPGFAASLSMSAVHHLGLDFGLVSMGLEVDPLFVGSSGRQWMYGAGASVWVGPEENDYAILFGFGAASHNGVLSRDQEGFPSVVGTVGINVRFGPIDGIHGQLRGGFALGEDLFTLGYLRGLLHLRLTPEVALRLSGEHHVAGAHQAGIGLRSWLLGRGDVGSVGLDVTGLLAWREFAPPTERPRGFAPAVYIFGPTLEVGLMLRL